MISETDKTIIRECAENYQAAAVYLFGSALRADTEPHDLDVGVKGLKPDVFFRFYGELMKRLSKPVDVVDLSEDSPFGEMVEKEGVHIYG